MMGSRMIFSSWELIWQLAKTDFKIRYNSSVLGYLWALLKPLLIFLILNFVFANIFGPQVPNYSLNLLTGIILWTYFSEATSAGMQSLLAKANLLTKVRVPQLAVVFAATIQSSITFLINLAILGVFFAFWGFTPTGQGILVTGVFIGLIYGLILGISLATAPFYVRYRDLNQVWEVLLILGFYASPIIYPLSLIPPQYQPFLWLNPMSYLIHYTKLALIDGQVISGDRLALLALVVGLILSAGMIIFRRRQGRVTEEL